MHEEVHQCFDDIHLIRVIQDLNCVRAIPLDKVPIVLDHVPPYEKARHMAGPCLRMSVDSGRQALDFSKNGFDLFAGQR